MAERLRKSLRLYDKIGRYGGEEFLIILRNESAETAKIVGERTRALVADAPFIWNEEEISVSISLGVAQLNKGQTMSNLIQKADQAMYAAKAKGKNCVVASEED